MGDPAGIGPEIIVKALGLEETYKKCKPLVIGDAKITRDDSVAKVSVVGAGMESHPGTASTMFEALFNQDINIQMISTSEIKISVLIDEKHSLLALEIGKALRLLLQEAAARQRAAGRGFHFRDRQDVALLVCAIGFNRASEPDGHPVEHLADLFLELLQGRNGNFDLERSDVLAG